MMPKAVVPLLALTAVPSCVLAKPPVKIHPPLVLSTTQLLALADQAIALEGRSPLPAEALVAMCLVESSGKIYAVGDGGRAVGLFQFWPGTWKDMTGGKIHRHQPLWQFIAAIRYAKRAEKLWAEKVGGPCPKTILFAHHNAGNIRGLNKSYAAKCFKKWKEISR